MKRVRSPNCKLEYKDGVLIKKQCSTCKDLKDVKFFSIKRSHSTGLEPKCKQCTSTKSKQVYERDAGKIKKRVNDYRLENISTIKEKKKVYNKKVIQEQWWKEKNSEKRRKGCKVWRENNPDKVKDYNKKYKDENKEMCLEITMRRVSSKRTKTLKLPIEQKKKISEFSLEVKRLNQEAGYKAYNVDHIVPLNNPNVSGLHVPWNLQIITSKENMSKRNKFDGTYENQTWKKDL